MTRVYKPTDKIEYKFGDLKIKVSPMTVEDKGILMGLMVKGQSKGDVASLMEGTLYALQVSIKEIQGLEDAEGNPYALTFGDDGKLTRECASDLLNIDQDSKLVSLCSSFMNGIPNKLPDGISLVESKTKNKKAQK